MPIATVKVEGVSEMARRLHEWYDNHGGIGQFGDDVGNALKSFRSLGKQFDDNPALMTNLSEVAKFISSKKEVLTNVSYAASTVNDLLNKSPELLEHLSSAAKLVSDNPELFTALSGASTTVHAQLIENPDLIKYLVATLKLVQNNQPLLVNLTKASGLVAKQLTPLEKMTTRDIIETVATTFSRTIQPQFSAMEPDAISKFIENATVFVDSVNNLTKAIQARKYLLYGAGAIMFLPVLTWYATFMMNLISGAIAMINFPSVAESSSFAQASGKEWWRWIFE